jgi:pilus assembly protein CpaC
MRTLREISIAALLAGLPLVASAQTRTLATPMSTPSLATPASMPTVATQHTDLAMEAGTGKVVTLPGPAANVFVADPKIAEVRPASASALFIFGVAAGRTTVAALDSDGGTIAHFEITVQPSAFGSSQAQAMIARLVPGSRVQVQPQAKGLVLSGYVSNAADAAQAVAIAKGFVGETQTVQNQLSVQAPMQVTLAVRIAQMSRTVVRNLGINWGALGNIGTIAKISPALTLATGALGIGAAATPPVNGNLGIGFNGVIDALANDNLAHILAEPNLTVMSGQPASFQVGGEIPIPVGQQGGTISIQYQPYGVMLTFLPTVLSDGRINIHVKPEVSDLDPANGVQIGTGLVTFKVPALRVRSAESTVELGSGQSFAIAGLMEKTTADNGTGLPGLGDVPILGALFHDNQFNRQEQELVILITPYIVRPVDNRAELHTPDETYHPPTDIERILYLHQMGNSQTPIPARIPGNAGFVVQ